MEREGGRGDYITLDDPTQLAAARRAPAPSSTGSTSGLFSTRSSAHRSCSYRSRPRWTVTADPGDSFHRFHQCPLRALGGRRPGRQDGGVDALAVLRCRAGGRPTGQFVEWLFSARPELPDRDPLDRSALASRLVAGGYPEAVERRGATRPPVRQLPDDDPRADICGLADIGRLEQLPALLTSIRASLQGPAQQERAQPGPGHPQYLHRSLPGPAGPCVPGQASSRLAQPGCSRGW